MTHSFTNLYNDGLQVLNFYASLVMELKTVKLKD